MKTFNASWLAPFALYLCVPAVALAQETARLPDPPAAVDTVAEDTAAERLGLWARRTRSSGLMLSSGKTYNRVEGLPVQLGPVFRDSLQSAAFTVQLLGIIRSADTFHWDSENLGHRATADVRVGRGRGYSLGLSSYDVVTPIETWQLGEPDASLATLFGHRAFRDYFGRHRATTNATFHMSA